MQASLQQFATAFAAHVKNHARNQAAKPPDARAKARAACKMQAEAGSVFATQFLAPFRDLLTSVEGLACDPYHVGVEGGCSTVASEHEYLASLRAVRSGTRAVIAMPYSAAVQVFGVMEPSVIRGKMFAASQAQMQGLAESKKMFTITHGVGDVLYLPQGWLFAERVTKTDCLAMMSRGLVLKDAEGLTEIGVIAKILPASAATAKDHEKLNLAQSTISSYITAAQEAASKAAQNKESHDAAGAPNEENGLAPATAGSLPLPAEQAMPAAEDTACNGGLTHL